MKRIKILGTGCPKCRRLAENAEAAAGQLGVEYEIEKVTDRIGMMRRGKMVVEGTLSEVLEHAGCNTLDDAFVTLLVD